MGYRALAMVENLAKKLSESSLLVKIYLEGLAKICPILYL
jgi:hypothetical protein